MKVTIQTDMSKVYSLLCSALEGGTGYWAQIDYDDTCAPSPENLYREPDHDDDDLFWYLQWPMSEGGKIYVIDQQDKNYIDPDCDDQSGENEPDNSACTYTLDIDALQRGLQLMADRYPHHFANFMSDGGDSETGDVFLQLCVLGDLLYG